MLKEHEQQLANQDEIFTNMTNVLVTLWDLFEDIMGATRSTHGIATASYMSW